MHLKCIGNKHEPQKRSVDQTQYNDIVRKKDNNIPVENEDTAGKYGLKEIKLLPNITEQTKRK